MLRTLYNLTEGQGNPSYLTDILPGGAGGNAVAGYTSVPFLANPTIERFEQEVNDNTPGAPALSGKLVTVQSFILGGGYFAQSQTPATPHPFGTYGIVNKPGLNDGISNPGSTAMVTFLGPINAYVETTNGVAIAPGTLLVADGLGNLTAGATTSGSAPGTAATSVVVTNVGTAGTTSYSYEVGSYSADGSTTAASSATTTTTGNALLSSTNYNHAVFTAGVGAAYYAIIRSTAPAGYATGIIGFTTSATGGVNDYGQPVIGQYPGSNTTVPAAFAPGTVLAKSAGTLAASVSTPTLIPVIVGGF